MSKTWVSSSSSTRSRRGRGAATVPRDQQRQEDQGFPVAPATTSEDVWDRQEQGYDYGGRREVYGAVGGEEYPNTSREAERRLQSQGAYYVQQPKPSQNQMLRSVAARETAEYDQHRMEKRAKVAESMRQLQPQTLGGSKSDVEVLRAQRVREQERDQRLNSRYAGIIQKQKREKYTSEKRMREEAEFEERKRKQREKAVRFEEKQEATEQMKIEEMRRARLARFENKQQ